MRESTVEAYLVERTVAAGGEVRKVKWLGRRGAPDRYVMLPPPVPSVWVELKRPGEVPRPHQVREHERMRRMGQRVEVLDTIEGVDALFREFGL